MQMSALNTIGLMRRAARCGSSVATAFCEVIRPYFGADGLHRESAISPASDNGSDLGFDLAMTTIDPLKNCCFALPRIFVPSAFFFLLLV